MKRLIIVGAGGFGREVLRWALDMAEYDRDWQIAGFLDDNLHALDDYGVDVSILGTVQDYQPGPDDLFAIAVGDPQTRIDLASTITKRGGCLATLIHPTAVIGDRVQIGLGSIICPYVVMTCDVTVGSLVIVNVHSTLGHDCKVGAASTLSCFCDVTGFVELGEGVFMGSHATVIPSVKVGHFARIGAGTTVIRNVRAGTTVFGVPGKQVF
jgi:sugar O-acyltransferase (sialic acid O-acetyltransferase NeuD family)